jgi:hypothetical protein
MRHLRWGLGLLAIITAVIVVNPANADRVPSRKAVAPTVSTAKTDIAVPYTTNGNSTLGVYQGVSPRIYSSPNVEDKSNPDVKPVYNLPFWGAIMSFGSKSNGATPRPTPGPFPSR